MPMQKVIDYKIVSGESAASIIAKMKKAGGFGAANLASGAEILRAMLSDRKCAKFLSFPANVIATGLRGVIAQAVKNFDVVVTTGGALDHDLARAWGGKYFSGSFDMDDAELHKKGIHRLGNVLIPRRSYGITLEKNMLPVLKKLARKKSELAGRELIEEFGKNARDKNSFLFQAAKHGIPVYCPGITDGAFGTNLAIFAQDNKFRLNLLKDEKELSDIVFDAKRTGALIVGGGISKHHILWWNQFKGGLDYAVYITTASERDGSLSGARTREAISWGKLKEKAKHVTIDGDATIILPFLLSAVVNRFI